MYIAVCDDQAEELEALTNLLHIWQAEHKTALRYKTFRNAYESYGVRALDYLLKPIRAEMLFPILDRLFLQEQRPREGLTLKSGSTLIRVPFSQLVYVEIMNKRLYFNLTDGQLREVAGSLKEYEELLLARPEFMRVGRSYIVNILQVQELSPAGISTFSGKNIPIPRRLYPQIQKDYMKLLFAAKEA